MQLGTRRCRAEVDQCGEEQTLEERQVNTILVVLDAPGHIYRAKVDRIQCCGLREQPQARLQDVDGSIAVPLVPLRARYRASAVAVVHLVAAYHALAGHPLLLWYRHHLVLVCLDASQAYTYLRLRQCDTRSSE